MKPHIVILHNEISGSAPDEIDVLAQRDLVYEACKNLNYTVDFLTVGEQILGDIEKVKAIKPDIVFNLVESVGGMGELIYFAPAILNALKIPYTGVPLDALFITTNKVMAKNLMRQHGLPTADYFSIDQINRLNPEKNYIVKPIWEEASIGITDDAVFTTSEKNKVKQISGLSSSHYFIEEFIQGREFNLSMLADKTGFEVLPPAEMMFSSYFDDKPKLVGYQAKWDEASDAYNNTSRAFATVSKDEQLAIDLVDISQRCWQVFNLNGYARVDYRVDANNQVYILEINGNPCIAPDSGFIAAVHEAGYSNEMAIERILADIN